MFELGPYLARLGMRERPTRDAAGLARLQLAHRLAIPFENLDVRLGRAIAIDSAAVFAKLVTARRGGYCFEQNRLFLDALAALGFVARPLLARVWLGAEAVPPLTHTLALVTIDDREWIADPGFGGSYAPPMPLIDGAEAIALDGARFRLEATGEGWLLLRDGDPATTDGRGTGPGWRPQYGFTTGIAHDSDLAMGNHWSMSAPASRFTSVTVVSRVLPDGFVSLTDRHYRRRAARESGQEDIAASSAYRARLLTQFGIELSDDDVERLALFR